MLKHFWSRVSAEVEQLCLLAKLWHVAYRRSDVAVIRINMDGWINVTGWFLFSGAAFWSNYYFGLRLMLWYCKEKIDQSQL